MTTKIYRMLYSGLRRRPMPETVARHLNNLLDLRGDNALLNEVTKVARARPRFSSMQEAWFEPVDLRRQLTVARHLFADWIEQNADSQKLCPAGEKDPARIKDSIAFLSRSIHKAPGRNSFKYDRLNREARGALGLELSSHVYNKRFRFLVRLEEHLKIYAKERRFLRYREVGKAGLVDRIAYDVFANNVWSAAFVAYYSARRQRRSVFTNTSQVRAYDRLSDILFERCRRSPDCNWFAIAHVFPEPQVLARLTEEQKGSLIGQWLMVLRDLAEELHGLWARSRIDLESMIVKKGDDSTSWNIAAQAWNSARTSWMAFLSAMDQDGFVGHLCPGKVLRLMAADVAAWHRHSGGTIHPDTLVWRELPFPWAVMRGQETCTRAMVEGACRRAGLDPRTSGWIEAKVSRKVAAFSPTPELVHGVTVGSPELAGVLRKAGVFSGK